MNMNYISKIVSVTKGVFKSKDGKTLVANFGYLSLLQVAGYVFPFITIPYLSKTIGVDGYGRLAFASAVIVWIQTIVDWGFNYTATRDVARQRDDKDAVSKIFSDVLWSRLLLMGISFLILIVLILSVPKLHEEAAVLVVTFLLVPGHILFPEWFFQALERMKYITIFNVLSKLFFTLAVFVFIQEKEDYIIQPLLISLGYIICGIISLYVIVKKWGYKIMFPSLKDIKSEIKKGVDVFINNIFPNLYNSLGTILLGFFWGREANGILDAGRKFSSALQQIISALIRTFFPFLARRPDKFRQFSLLTIGIGTLLSTLLFLFSPLLIHLFFSPEFEPAINVARLMSVVLLFNTLSGVYGGSYMILQGYEKQLRNITIACSILAFIVSVPLIYFYSFIGCAIELVLAIMGLGVIPMIFVYRKEKNNTSTV